MIQTYPLVDDDEEVPEGWDQPGYHDDAVWVVTYQYSQHSQIYTLFEGPKSQAVAYFDVACEDMG